MAILPDTPAVNAPARRVAVWAEPGQAPLVAEIAALAGVQIAAAGSPSRGQTGALAKELGCPGQDDLRAVLATTDAEAVLIFAAGDFGLTRDSGDLEAVQGALARGVKVATIDPIPAGLFGGAEQAAAAAARPGVQFLPRLRRARPILEAHEVLGQIGPPRTLSIEAWSIPGAGTLGAALYDAMDFLNWLMGDPRLIDAVHLAPGGGAGRAPASLRDLHGDLTAVVRFDEARAATLVLSDQAGRWGRAATLNAANGRFRVFDDGFEWIGPEGQRLDELRVGPARRGDPQPPRHAEQAIARAVAELLGDAPADPGGATAETVMVLCETALLSARTSQAESPESIRRMLAGP